MKKIITKSEIKSVKDIVEVKAKPRAKAPVECRLQGVIVGNSLNCESLDALIVLVWTELRVIRRQLILWHAIQVRREGQIEAMATDVG